MPGYGPTQLNYQARNANSVAVTIGDTIVAFAQTTSHSFGYGTQTYHGVGSAQPQEIQQLIVAPTISLDAFALTDTGIQYLAGGENIAVLLANNQFDIHVTDGIKNKVIFTYVGCVAQNFSQNIPANQPVSESISFAAMDVLGPDGQSVLNVPGAFSVPNALATAGSVAGSLGLNPI